MASRAQSYCYVRLEHSKNSCHDDVAKCTLTATELKRKRAKLPKPKTKTWFEFAAEFAAARCTD
jgi:hypothetical protein